MGRSKMMTQASDTQVGGTHYKDMGEFQPWDVLQHWLTPEEYRGYQKGVAITYLARERQKGGDTDISKAAHHLQKLVEVLGNKNVSVKVGIDNAPQCLTITDEWIDQVIASMPGGMNGFLKTWGLQQFARAVVEAHRDPAPTPAPDDGWIEWHGGECPVPPDALVQWKLRGWPEEIIGPERAGDRFWEHRSSSNDIIAYRVVRKAEAPTEAPTEAPAPDDGWIQWLGGKCPVPEDTFVEFKVRAAPNQPLSPIRAGLLLWRHRHPVTDIIAYRVVDAPEVCCGNHATCTKPCVPRVQLHADADGWILHDRSNVCPVPPDVVVTACPISYPDRKVTQPAHALNWVSVGLYKISESK